MSTKGGGGEEEEEEEEQEKKKTCNWARRKRMRAQVFHARRL